jgi:hypothetical protein
MLHSGFDNILCQEQRNSTISHVRLSINAPTGVLFVGPKDNVTWNLETELIEADLVKVESDTLILTNIYLVNDMEHRGEIERELQVSLDELDFMLSISSTKRIEVSRGRKNNIAKGALIGFVGGAVTGLLIGKASCTDCTDEGGFTAPFYGALVIGAAGAAVGAGIGAVSGSERWEEVSPDSL